MFSLKQETGSGEKIWPGVNHVYTCSENAIGTVDRVTALFEAGGLMDFDASQGRHIIYVMNERGSTVARYDIGNRPQCMSAAHAPLGDEAMQASSQMLPA